MARVTVEDCIDKVANRFELILLSSTRAREISKGIAPKIKQNRDKNPVIALREIADDLLDLGELRENIIQSMQRPIVARPLVETEISHGSTPNAHFEQTKILDDDPPPALDGQMTEQEMIAGYQESGY